MDASKIWEESGQQNGQGRSVKGCKQEDTRSVVGDKSEKNRGALLRAPKFVKIGIETTLLRNA